MRIEEVDGGHFLPDEQPAIVAEQALALFSRCSGPLLEPPRLRTRSRKTTALRPFSSTHSK